MEFDPLPDKKSPIKVPRNLTSLLIEFTISCLVEKPDPIIPYAVDYFEAIDRETHIEEVCAEEHVEEEFELPEDFPEFTRGRGRVVYSEPYNPEKDDSDEDEIIEYEKTQAQKEILLNVVKKCLLFKSLDTEQLNRVIAVMFPKDVIPGNNVIKQYDDGDNFYIIEYGRYDVFIADEPDSTPKYIFTYENEGSFGELALMYNMPRAATVTAKTEGRLWAMDRTTFRRIVLKAAFKKRKMYEDLLSRVPMLQELTPYEKMNLADALIPKTYKEDEIIMEQGEEADGMYFIEKGSVDVQMYNIKHASWIDICKIGEGGYFGELALVTNQVRAATVKALEETRLAFLDVAAFERILGPCMNIMKRNIDTYKEVQDLLGISHSAIAHAYE